MSPFLCNLLGKLYVLCRNGGTLYCNAEIFLAAPAKCVCMKQHYVTLKSILENKKWFPGCQILKLKLISVFLPAKSKLELPYKNPPLVYLSHTHSHILVSTHPFKMGLNSYQMVPFPHSSWKHFFPKIVLSAATGQGL